MMYPISPGLIVVRINISAPSVRSSLQVSYLSDTEVLPFVFQSKGFNVIELSYSWAQTLPSWFPCKPAILRTFSLSREEVQDEETHPTTSPACWSNSVFGDSKGTDHGAKRNDPALTNCRTTSC